MSTSTELVTNAFLNHEGAESFADHGDWSWRVFGIHERGRVVPSWS